MVSKQEHAQEVVVFKLKPGVGEREYLDAAESIDAWLRRQPGFVRRRLTKAVGGDQYIEVAEWRTVAEAEAAAAASMSEPSLARVFSMLEEQGTLFLIGGPVD
ncbi:MAG: hypothetical protein FJ318_05610 [SAR202 cluster bacterium]|nr:hypothetical protein [SAR202 cluster bacterium]